MNRFVQFRWKLTRLIDRLKSSRLVRECATLQVVVPPVLNVPPELKSAAPVSPMTDYLSKPYLICFMRHLGCPFAEMTVLELSQLQQKHQQIDFIVVSHCSLRETEFWLNQIAPDNQFVTVIDEERDLYGRWGLGCTGLGHFLGVRSLITLVRLARRGLVNRSPSGSRWQQAGAFAVNGDGRVVWRHLPKHAGDLPQLDAVVSILNTTEQGKFSQVS